VKLHQNDFQCRRFCIEQVVFCRKQARLNIDLQQRRIFNRTAADWKHYAKRCGGRSDACIVASKDTIIHAE